MNVNTFYVYIKYTIVYNKSMTTRIATTKRTVMTASFDVSIRGGKAKQ